MKKKLFVLSSIFILCFVTACNVQFIQTRPVLADLNDEVVQAPISVLQFGFDSPCGVSPAQIRAAYNLPSTGGNGTIAIILWSDDPYILSDANVFCSQYGLPPLINGTNFIEHWMLSHNMPEADEHLAAEYSLDVEWAHAIAPNATILLVESISNQDGFLLQAVNYARNQPNVVAISMSWGGPEFPEENSTLVDSYFTSPYNATFFAASGDSGQNVSWPAASPNVVGVGGTTLTFNATGSVASEVVWNNSWGDTGGGVSEYETEPSYQASYGIQGSNGNRGVPDVSYAADPEYGSSSGFSIYSTLSGGWTSVYGTSAGAPQWAGIQSLGLTTSNPCFYTIAKSLSYPSCFRDIVNGTNGNYSATVGYDFCTGLGSPLTNAFGAWMNSFNVYLNDPTQNLTTLHSGNSYTATVNLTWNGTTTNNVYLGVHVYDANGSWAWNGLNIYSYLAPGQNSSSVSLDEFYPQVGTGTLQVTLTNNTGYLLMAPWNETVNIVNTNHPPNPPSFNYPGTGSNGTRYGFTVNANDPDVDNVQYILNWGDGSGNTTLGWCASGVAETGYHTWTNAGWYTVEAYVHDPYGGWNNASVQTYMNSTGSGGGGGCPYVYDWNGTNFIEDNNILPASQNGNGTDTKDYYMLQQPLVPVYSTRKSSVYSLKIGEFETNVDYIDQVKLFAADCSQGTSIAFTQTGEIFAYQSLVTPISVVDKNGNSELTRINTINGNLSDPSTYYQGNKGDWLLLDFGKVTGPTANLVLRDDKKCAECIYVQVPDGSGGWQNVTVLNPRDYWGVEAVNMTAYLPANGDFIVRLFWTQTHNLDFVGLDTSAQAPPQVTSAPPTLANHSTMGDVTQKLLHDDEQCVQLVNGQSMTIWFTLPNQARGTIRSFILFTDGYYYTIS